MYRKFQNKVVVITGGAGGLGLALVRKFAKQNAKIAVLDRDENALSSLQKEAKSNQWIVNCYLCDVSIYEDCQTSFKQLNLDLGPIYLLINNAGITHIGKFNKDHVNAVEEVMGTNFFGAVNCTSLAIKDIQSNQGMIIPIASIAGLVPLINRSCYSASKHSLIGFFESIRMENIAFNVQILMVCPSAISTNIRKRAIANGEEHFCNKSNDS